MIAWKKDYPIPSWANKLLQGSAFWVGYKSQLYHYPLTEGAIVGEAAALLNSALASVCKLECEVMYKKLNVPYNSQWRADIVIKEGDRLNSVIEVKREKSSKKDIEKDLSRLSIVNKANPSVRCFLLIVSQKKRPIEYVNEEGNANESLIHGNGYIAKVRRVCKASTSFKKINSASYSCLIEVVSNE